MTVDSKTSGKEGKAMEKTCKYLWYDNPNMKYLVAWLIPCKFMSRETRIGKQG